MYNLQLFTGIWRPPHDYEYDVLGCNLDILYEVRKLIAIYLFLLFHFICALSLDFRLSFNLFLHGVGGTVRFVLDFSGCILVF
jgi:hypothetical protein